MTTAFTLPSNDGWNAIKFSLISRITVEGENVLVFRIEIDGEYWDRADWKGDGGGQSAELKPDFSVVLQQVLIAEASLDRLSAAPEAWLSDRDGEMDFEFDCPDDQDLILSVGKWPGFVLGLEKAVFNLSYAAPTRLDPLDVKFVVEETCIRSMKNGVDAMRRELAS